MTTEDMPYPSDTPVCKHDLVGPRTLVKGVDQDLIAEECQFSSPSNILEALDRSSDPSNLRLLCPVYSYGDAPQQQPLSRALVMIGVADASLLPHEELSSWTKCTLAVKRADPEHASHLAEKDIVHSHTFAKFMRLLRNKNKVAVLGTDKWNRIAILKPMPVFQSEDSSYTADEFALNCLVGNADELKQYLSKGDAVEATTGEAQAADDTTGGLWQPPGTGGGEESSGLWQPPKTDDGDSGGLWQPPGTDDGDSGGLWQPPGADSSGGAMDYSENAGFNAWGNENNNDMSGQKRKLSDDDQQEFHADEGAAAADAFYSGLTRSLDTRADSWLYHMRAFNGWVKATQIQELDPKTKSKKLRVLDLACGKGGDLSKWNLHTRGIGNYVGVDVARGSLRDAALRARKMKKLKKCTFTCADLGADVPGRLRSARHKRMQKLLSWSRQDEADNETSDPEFKMVRGGGISLRDKFDVVSIQFAIHYMMSSRTRARRFFQTVSELLEIGGNLIATTIDARVVVDHLMGLGLDLHFDNDSEDMEEQSSEGALIQVGGGACRIQVDNDTLRKLFSSRGSNEEDMFGLQYTFTLVEGSDHAAGVGDAVNLPEWLTPIRLLESLAAEAGLELESSENFHEFYAKRRDPSAHFDAHAALYNMKVLDRNGSLSKDEWEISRLYVALKFKKVRESNMTLEDVSEDEGSDESDNEHDEAEKANEKVLTPEMKAKNMPMALLKAKKSVGADEWKALSGEEKKRIIEEELKKMAS